MSEPTDQPDLLIPRTPMAWQTWSRVKTPSTSESNIRNISFKSPMISSFKSHFGSSWLKNLEGLQPENILTLTKSKRTSRSICSSPFLSLDLLMHFTLDRSLIGVLNGILTLPWGLRDWGTVETSRDCQIFCDIKCWSWPVPYWHHNKIWDKTGIWLQMEIFLTSVSGKEKCQCGREICED